MMILRFKSEEDHEALLKKVKKMRKFTEELEECLEEMIESGEADFRGGRYRHEDYDEEEMRHEGRYNYRRGSGRGRM